MLGGNVERVVYIEEEENKKATDGQEISGTSHNRHMRIGNKKPTILQCRRRSLSSHVGSVRAKFAGIVEQNRLTVVPNVSRFPEAEH
jgi:hypothetical protein